MILAPFPAAEWVHGVNGRPQEFAVKSTELRPGMAVKLDGNLFVITQFTHVTPGNLRAFVSIKIKNVVNGSIIEKRLRSGEDIEVIDLDDEEEDTEEAAEATTEDAAESAEDKPEA